MKKTLQYVYLFAFTILIEYWILATLFPDEATTHFFWLMASLLAALIIIAGHFFAECINNNPIITSYEIKHPFVKDNIQIREKKFFPDKLLYYLPKTTINSTLEIGSKTVDFQIIIPEEPLGDNLAKAKIIAGKTINKYINNRTKDMIKVINATMQAAGIDQYTQSVERK